jgi:hypothetical protein
MIRRASKVVRRTWKAAAILIAVFLLDGLAGGAVARTMAMRELAGVMRGPPSEARARFRMEAMRRHLDLDDAQAKQLETIVADAETERETLMNACKPGLDELRERTEARIRAVLRPDQLARHEEMEKHRPGPPGGPRHGPRRHRRGDDR